jgi:hypothetical protein
MSHFFFCHTLRVTRKHTHLPWRAVPGEKEKEFSVTSVADMGNHQQLTDAAIDLLRRARVGIISSSTQSKRGDEDV